MPVKAPFCSLAREPRYASCCTRICAFMQSQTGVHAPVDPSVHTSVILSILSVAFSIFHSFHTDNQAYAPIYEFLAHARGTAFFSRCNPKNCGLTDSQRFLQLCAFP